MAKGPAKGSTGSGKKKGEGAKKASPSKKASGAAKKDTGARKKAAAPKKSAAPSKKTKAAPSKKKEAAPSKKKEAAPSKKKEAAPSKKKEAAPSKKKEAASSKPKAAPPKQNAPSPEKKAGAPEKKAPSRRPSSPPPAPEARRPWHPEPRKDLLAEAIALPGAKEQLGRFYAGSQMPSPMGGFLEFLGVRPEDDGTGTLLFECSSSSLRFKLTVPAATRTEKKRVKERQAAGDDPTCPRHDPSQRLNRAGTTLVCPLCGIPYGRVS